MGAECGTDLTISRIKPLSDFAGNQYYVVEFEPTGYLICHGEYGETLEYAEESPSPYLGMEGNLLYAGPTYYYSLKEEALSNPVFGEKVNLNDTSSIAALTAISDDLTNNIAEAAKFHVESAHDTAQLAAAYSTLENTTISVNAAPTPTGTKHYVPNDTVGAEMATLRTSEQMGYVDGGICGYIATGLLFYWLDEIKGIDWIINDFAYLNGRHSGFVGGNLSRKLRTYGSENGSDAAGYLSQSIKEVIESYAADNYLTITTEATPLGTDAGVIEAMQQNAAPVIVFSYIAKDGVNFDSHAVLAYGYTSTGQVLVHYGHPNYPQVVLHRLSPAHGSYLAYKHSEKKNIYISDVSSSHWGQEAIDFAVRYQLFTLNGGRFFPDSSASRAAFVRALYYLAGEPDVSSYSGVLNKYTDRPGTDSQYYSAVVWAVANGILTGTSETTLELWSALTREQSAVFLNRYCNKLNCSFSSTSGPSYTTFSDYTSVSDYAKANVNWATRRYLLRGDNGRLYPLNTLTNAETAQLLYNLTKAAHQTR